MNFNARQCATFKCYARFARYLTGKINEIDSELLLLAEKVNLI